MDELEKLRSENAKLKQEIRYYMVTKSRVNIHTYHRYNHTFDYDITIIV